MYKHTNTIFNQLLSFLPKNRFEQYVGQHKADKGCKKMSTWNQFVLMLFAQATGKDSLREIETGFKMHQSLWYHLGVKTTAKSTLSDANNRHSYEIFEKLFYALLVECRRITPNRNFKFENALYSLDSTVIKLCLSVFDWAKYTKTKGALKLHTLLNNRSSIPEFLIISDGKKGDITAAKEIDLKRLEKGSILTFDRAYIDYEWWNQINKKEMFFVSRTKNNQNIFVLGQHNKILEKGIISDKNVMFGDYNAQKKYPRKLRMVKYYDENTQKTYTYLTNNFKLTAIQIATIYKNRWQIELFFKWIKQNLKIKTFLGTSKNAVLTQIWIAMIYYLLLAYIKFQTKFSKSLLELTRMVKETLMLRRNLIDLLSLTTQTINKITYSKIPQLTFW